MEQRTITISEFVKNGIEPNIQYSITKDKPLKWRFDDWLRSKGLDSYSRSVKRDYKRGITRDLSYNNTLDKCDDKQHIGLIWVDGYSSLMKIKESDEIDKSVEFKVNKLISDGKVGYLDGDSFGCYLACDRNDYAELCRYFKVDIDKDFDDKEYYYNSLFDSIEMMLRDFCDIVDDLRQDMNERQWDRFDKTIYDVARYVIVNIERYKDILLSARDCYECTKDELWTNRLWLAAYNDMKEGK